MSTVVARLNKSGDLLLKDEISERLPVVTSGLIAHFPFDGTTLSTGSGVMYVPAQTLESKKNLIDAHYLDWRDPNNWTGGSGTGTLSWDATQQCLVADGYRWWVFQGYIQIDTTKSWYMEADMMKIGSNGTAYLGDVSYNISFALTTQHPGTYEYFGASGVVVPSTWTRYNNSGISGVARTGISSTSSDTAKWDTNCVYIRPLIIANYTGGVVGTDKLYIRNLRLFFTDANYANNTLDSEGLFVEEATSNLFGSRVNTHPTIGNAWGTYNTNQYNGGSYFSIGTISGVSNNIVTYSSAHALRTYDVVTPQTTGGGVTAGTYYLVKAISSTQFTLHAYSSSQDGSQGFKVHDSLRNDIRVPVNATNFPTMWIGPAHAANSGLVKEIILGGYKGLHDCIRLHTEHRSDGVADGMAYDVNIGVTSGSTYTISFKHRAANSYAVGRTVTFQTYNSGNGVSTSNSFTVGEDWTLYTKTLTAGATGTLYFYWFPTAGMAVDMAEIHAENKAFATSYTSSSRSAGAFYLPNVLNRTECTLCFTYNTNNAYPQSYSRLLEVGGWASPMTNDWISIYRGVGWGSDGLNVNLHDYSTSTTVASVTASGINSRLNHEIFILVGWSVTSKLGRVYIYDKTTNEVLVNVSNSVPAFDGFGTYTNTTIPIMTLSGLQNARINNLSFYNRLVSDSEVKKLAGQSFEVTSGGKLIANKVIERPNSIPADVYYFPLDIDTEDEYRLYSRLLWTNIAYVTVTDNIVSKTSGTDNTWDAGCNSADDIYGNCCVEFKASENNSYKMMGLSNGNSTASYTDIDFAIYACGDGIVYIRESGTNMGGFGAYTNSDILKVEANGTTVRYYKNNVLLYTSLVAPTYPLRVDCAIYTTNGSFNSIRFSQAVPNLVYENNSIWVGNAVTNIVTGADNPDNGWGSRTHTTVQYYNLPIGTGYYKLPTTPNCKGYKLTSSYAGDTWGGNAYSYTGIGSPSVVAGDVYTASVWCYVSTDSNLVSADGDWVRISAEGVSGSPTSYYDLSKKGTWQKLQITMTCTGTGNAPVYLYYCMAGVTNFSTMTGYIIYYAPQLTKKAFDSPFVSGSRALNRLYFNFNASLGLSWAGSWSIVYWKRPIGTHGDLLTSYNIESLGCNSNSVGGGYTWWGKATGSNTIQDATPSSIDPAKYFGTWRMVSLVKSGTTITIKEWSPLEGIYVRTVSTTNSVANYYVTQYGYDFFLGGWDGAYASNSYYRDLIVAKRAFTDAELTALFRTHMRAYKDRLQIQGNFIEGGI